MVVGVKHTHVVRHEIENESNIRLRQCGAQLLEGLFAAEFGVEGVVVNHVIAVNDVIAHAANGGPGDFRSGQCEQ